MELHVVEIEKGHPGLRKNTPGDFTKDEMETIAHHFNCHEKLVNTLNKYGNHLPKCKYLQGLKGQVIEECDCGFEQALKEKP